MSINIIKHEHSVLRNTSGGRSAVKYIVMHYTATDGATAKNEVMYFALNPAATNASADFFVDDKEIWQYNTAVDSRYSWAVGDGSGGSFGGVCSNANQVSVEMSCYCSGGRWYICEETYRNAVSLVRYLMGKYGVPPQRVIRHYDVSGKLCPNAVGWLSSTGSDSVWERFKHDIEGTDTEKSGTETKAETIYRVRRSADDARSQIGAYRNLAGAKALADKNRGYSVFDNTGELIYTPKTGAEKTNEQLAREVIAGRWGNGADRKKRLTAAGYDYSAVQSIVNKLMS